MTNAQKRFCDEYLIDLNATRAYKVAYPSSKKEETINAAASRLLRNVKVKAYIEERIKERQQQIKITQDMVLKELAKIGFFNIKDIYNEDGTLKKATELEDDVASVISSVKTLQRAGGMKLSLGKDEGIPIEHIPEQTIEYKMNDKVKALELMGKHLGMFKETNINVEMNYEDYIKRVEGDEY